MRCKILMSKAVIHVCHSKYGQRKSRPGGKTSQLEVIMKTASKRRFSQFPSEPACNQEYAGGLEQGLDDEAEPVVAQREAPVFEHPSIAALHRPAPLAEP